MNEERIRQTAFRRLAINLLGDILQCTCLCIHTDVEMIGILARGSVNKATIARSDIYDHTLASIGCDQSMECPAIKSGLSSAANKLEHKLLPFSSEYILKVSFLLAQALPQPPVVASLL